MSCDFDPTLHPHPRRKIRCPRCGRQVVTGVEHFPPTHTPTMDRLLAFIDTRPKAEDFPKVEDHAKAMSLYVHHFDQYVIAITYNRSYNHNGGKYGAKKL